MPEGRRQEAQQEKEEHDPLAMAQPLQPLLQAQDREEASVPMREELKLEVVKTLLGHAHGVNCLLATEKILFSGASDKTIKLWDIETFSCLGTLTGHKAPVNDLVMSMGWLISCSNDKTLKAWEVQSTQHS